MNTKKGNSFRGFGSYLLLILVFVVMWYFLDGRTSTNAYTRQQFEADIKSESIVAYHVVQNREVPTGYVLVTLKDETQRRLIVSDVNEITAYLQEQGIKNYTQADIPAESWIMTVLPYLLIF